MQLPKLGSGVAFAAGGTNLREALCDPEGNFDNSRLLAVPKTQAGFFGHTARVLLEAGYNGATWGVLGVPGPVSVIVSPEDEVTQNLRVTNIPALSAKKGVDPIAKMIKADPAIADLLESGFTFLTVNDGDLAVQAGAKLYGEDYDVVADAINGTGTGGAVARRDKRFPRARLYHPDPGLWETGHEPSSHGFPSHTLETTISGSALEKHLGRPLDELKGKHPIHNEVAHGLGMMVVRFGLYAGAELVVMSGGVGINAQDHYKDELNRVLDGFRESGNPMADKVPDVTFPPHDMADTYELHGAHGAILSHLTRRAIDQLVINS